MATQSTEHPNVWVFDHPVIQDKLARTRDIATGHAEFRRLLNEIAGLMFFQLSKDFCEILSQQYNKKILFRIPPYLVKILAGEMGNEMILSSSKIYPKKLKEAGYKFEFNELPDLLKSFA